MRIEHNSGYMYTCTHVHINISCCVKHLDQGKDNYIG